MVINLKDLLISVHIDIYFFISLIPRWGALPYPLPAGHVDIRHWAKPKGEVYYGPGPYDEGCIKIATILDLAQ